MKKDWNLYCEKTFNNLKANSHKNGDHHHVSSGIEQSHEITTLVSLIVEIQITLDYLKIISFIK